MGFKLFSAFLLITLIQGFEFKAVINPDVVGESCSNEESIEINKKYREDVISICDAVSLAGSDSVPKLNEKIQTEHAAAKAKIDEQLAAVRESLKTNPDATGAVGVDQAACSSRVGIYVEIAALKVDKKLLKCQTRSDGKVKDIQKKIISMDKKLKSTKDSALIHIGFCTLGITSPKTCTQKEACCDAEKAKVVNSINGLVSKIIASVDKIILDQGKCLAEAQEDVDEIDSSSKLQIAACQSPIPIPNQSSESQESGESNEHTPVQPEGPNVEQPGQPGEPGNPNVEQPGEPGAEQPGESESQESGESNEHTPVQPEGPNVEQPGQPGEPGNPNVEQPGEPGAEQPGVPSVEQPGEPENPNVEQPSEPGAEQPGKPSEPQEPAVEQPSEPETPTVEQPSEPGAEQPGEPSEPAVEQPSEPETPTVEQPSEPQEPAVEQPTEPETPSGPSVEEPAESPDLNVEEPAKPEEPTESVPSTGVDEANAAGDGGNEAAQPA